MYVRRKDTYVLSYGYTWLSRIPGLSGCVCATCAAFTCIFCCCCRCWWSCSYSAPRDIEILWATIWLSPCSPFLASYTLLTCQSVSNCVIWPIYAYTCGPVGRGWTYTPLFVPANSMCRRKILPSPSYTMPGTINKKYYSKHLYVRVELSADLGSG